MEAGTIVEFNHPNILLKNPNSRFSQMVADSDWYTYEKLKKIAEDCYQKKI